jgi:hypothetical protein
MMNCDLNIIKDSKIYVDYSKTIFLSNQWFLAKADLTKSKYKEETDLL